MKAVWKYVLPFSRLEDEARQSHLMPGAAQFRACAMQHGEITLWFEVDPRAAGEARTFQIVGIGHPEIDDTMSYLGTVLMDDGFYVWHIYEVH